MQELRGIASGVVGIQYVTRGCAATQLDREGTEATSRSEWCGETGTERFRLAGLGSSSNTGRASCWPCIVVQRCLRAISRRLSRLDLLRARQTLCCAGADGAAGRRSTNMALQEIPSHPMTHHAYVPHTTLGTLFRARPPEPEIQFPGQGFPLAAAGWRLVPLSYKRTSHPSRTLTCRVYQRKHAHSSRYVESRSAMQMTSRVSCDAGGFRQTRAHTFSERREKKEPRVPLPALSRKAIGSAPGAFGVIKHGCFGLEPRLFFPQKYGSRPDKDKDKDTATAAATVATQHPGLYLPAK